MNDILVSAAGIDRPGWSGRLSRFCSKVLGAIGVDDWEVSILLCDEDTMRLLNGKYRAQSRPTDVLSFRQKDLRSPGQPAIVGDVVVCPKVLLGNAREWGVPADEELRRLIVHGILHLAGMDHGSGNRGKMFTLQEKLLCELADESILPRDHRPGTGSPRSHSRAGVMRGGKHARGGK
jgi:probable rRNA maturation factor